MQYRILGPLEVGDGREIVALGGAKPRTLLAVLLVHANEVVSSERLVDELWGARPPRSAAKLVQGYVSRLRTSLGAALETRPPGYRMRVEPGELDLLEFLGLANDAREAARGGELDRAADLFSRALALGRGVALADVELHGPASVEVDRLAELQLGVLLDRFDVDLARGRHAEIAGDLEALAVTNPLQERLHGQLMVALYRAGRQADALRVYREARARLVDELGLEPGEDLQALEVAILRHDRTLDPPTRAGVAALGAGGAEAPAPPPAPPREERRLATLLAVDLAAGPTGPADDPESGWTARMAAQQAVEREVARHGGVIEHVAGDQVLALFGVPESHEDDAERAVRAAASALAAGEGPSLRAAVEGGEVLVAPDGAGRRRLVGPVIGGVQRLLAAAAPGQILVGGAARAETAGAVEYRELHPEPGAGPVWEVSGLGPSRVGGHRPLHLDAGLVGRRAELDLLRRTFERVRSERRPALVTVLGAAGMGKSRLAHELVRHVEAATPSARVRRGRCLAYGNVSYSALAGALKAECGVAEDDPPEVVSDRVARRVGEVLGDRSAVPAVEVLVGAGGGTAVDRAELFDVWRRVLEGIASAGPLVLVLEDLHWADEGLLDFVDHVTDWADGPLLVLALARPELLDRRPAWGWGKASATSVTLEPLSPAETETLAEELLSAPAPPGLVHTLVERSAGNPLFAEELVRMLVEQGALRATGTRGWELRSDPAGPEVPRSIRAVITAHLDALPQEERDILGAAAVAGRVFWVGAVERIGGYGTRETRELLWRLRSRDLVVAHEGSAFTGEAELAFRHVLIRDVAYDSLPKRRRVDAHVAMATWAAERAAGRQDEIAELLATHSVHALGCVTELGDPDGRRAQLQADVYRWARAAGERAVRLWQPREAVRWYREALDAASGVEVGLPELAALREAYAHACEGVEPYAEVAGAFEAALALYAELGDRAAAGRMEAWRAFAAFQSGDEAAVLGWSARALRHLEADGSRRDLALALTILGWAHRRSGRFDEAEPRLRRAVEVAATAGDSVMSAQATAALGKCLQQSGNVEEGLPLLERALELARAAGDLPVLLRALLDLSEAHEEATGDYRRAEELMREGVALARRAGHRQQVAWMESNLADYLVDVGRLDEAEPLARSGLAESRHVGEPRRIALTLPTVSYLALLRGDLGEAARSLAELRALSQDVGEVYPALWLPLLSGLYARASGRREEAARILLEGARRQAGRTEIWGSINLLIEAARMLAHRGRRAEAGEPRALLAALAPRSRPAAAFLAWADGLLEPEPERALARLRAGASLLRELARRVELGRCLTDCARVEAALGRDPGPALAEARALLEGCGAPLFLGEVAEVEARA